MESLKQYGSSGEDSGSEDSVASWAGDAPDDATPLCVFLHSLICRVYGEGRDVEAGKPRRPCWYHEMSMDINWIDFETWRRGLLAGSLEPFMRLPYMKPSAITSVEYQPANSSRVDGWLFGTGEKLGQWDAFTLFYRKPDYDNRNLFGEPTIGSFELGQEVEVGELRKDAIVARILRGTKPAGKAGSGKTQQVYYALLKVGNTFAYAALQHIYHPAQHPAPSISPGWFDDISDNGAPLKVTQLADFKPKSVSAVAKSAAKFVATLATGNKSAGGARGGGARGGARGVARGGARAGGAHSRAGGAPTATGKRARVEASSEEEGGEEEEEESSDDE